jgi:prevent-host-death family protein
LTIRSLLCKVSYVKTTISLRELQQNLERVIAQVKRGQVIEVTRHRRPIARLVPLRPAGCVSPWPVSPWRDLEERARTVFGDRTTTPGASQLVIEDREER